MTRDKDKDEQAAAEAAAAAEPKADEGQEPELERDEQGRTVVQGPASSSSDPPK